jgi:threonine aldolase
MTEWRGFGSDNHAGVHPAVFAAMAEANRGHARAYGDDPWTTRATEALRRVLDDPGAQIAFVWNGTGANVVCLSALCRPWESVICTDSAHIATDECAAPEHISSVKLVSVPTPDGKLTPELVRPHINGFGFEHHAQPRVISVSQASELGTVYSLRELRALADIAHENRMFLHVDGARLANAAVGLGVGLGDVTHNAGVDAVSLGGTKNGMLAGEAVVLFDDARTEALPYVRKQTAQLASKMRFIAAQFIAMFEGDLWRECASNANAMAARLAEGARTKGARIKYSVQANEIFAALPGRDVASIAERFHSYTWPPGFSLDDSLVRWVTSWDTSEQDVDELLAAL